MLHFIHVTDIKWDTDDEKVDNLPENVLIVANTDGYEKLYEDECGIADFLSDNYGYCIGQFDAGEYLENNPKLDEVVDTASDVLLAK